MVTLSSTSKNTLHHLQTFNSINNIHDAIFSPYTKEGNFVGKLSDPTQKINPFINTKNSPLHYMEKTKESEEIGVFGAEKYFHGVVEVETPRSTKYLQKRDEQIETRKYQVEYGTPSILSDSTSNSQSALLHSGLRNSLRTKKKEKEKTKSVLYGLGFKCSCSDKDSVDISDHAGEATPRKAAPNLGQDGNIHNHSIKMSKPNPQLLINNEKKNLALNHLVKMKLQLDEDTPRKSLEVFGSPMILNKKTKSLSIDKRLVFPSSTKFEEIDSNFDDAASDASSDLFEIESFKGKSNTLLATQATDSASGCASPTCYAPSEASIEWSVVTASAAVMSDCEEKMSDITIRSPIRPQLISSSNGKSKGIKEAQRRKSSTLLGCKSHKAVRVAGNAFITYEKSNLSPRIGNKINSSQVARFPGETKMGSFGARHGQHGYATPVSMQGSNSPHASKLLYI